MDIERTLEQQQVKAEQIAKILKSGSYGKSFTYDFQGQKITEVTKFGLKTIKHLLTRLRAEHKTINLEAFEDANREILLSDSVQLKEQTGIFIFSIQQNNMAYIHVFGKQEQISFYVNLDMTLQEFINNYNKSIQNEQDRIDINQDQYILSDYLQPGGYIRTQMINHKLSEFLKEGDEGLFRLEKQQ